MDIYLLTDYLDRFESRVPAIPYRSGLDKNELKNEFISLGYNPIFLNYSVIDFHTIDFKDKYICYTSSEDNGLFYKDFIEDILWGIKLQGGILLPDITLQRAHHNKVFMEILRAIKIKDSGIRSRYFGSYTELLENMTKIPLPAVIKSAAGSGSKGVKLAKNIAELKKDTRKLTNTHTWVSKLTETGLLLKRFYQTKQVFKLHKLHRNKIVTQNFIPNLEYDWKVLIYGDKYYVLQRLNRTRDFRASGSGKFFSVDHEKFHMPDGLLDFARRIYEEINIPILSIDVAYDQIRYYLIEFQGLNFGTFTQTTSNAYFQYQENAWGEIHEKLPLEHVYARGIDMYIKKQMLKRELETLLTK